MYISFLQHCCLWLLGLNGVLRDYNVNQEIKQYEREVATLQKKRLESMEILEYVSSDAFVEEKARTELQMKKSKERVVYVHRGGTQGDVVVEKEYTAKQARVLQEVANPTKWWYYFTHKEL